MEKKEYDDLMEHLCEVSNQKRADVREQIARQQGILEGMEYMICKIGNYYRSTKNEGE